MVSYTPKPPICTCVLCLSSLPRVFALLRSFHEHTFQSEPLPAIVRNNRLSMAHQLQKVRPEPSLMEEAPPFAAMSFLSLLQTSAILDLLSLPAVLSSPDTTAMETDEVESRPQSLIPGLSITSSWQQLQSLAGCFLEEIGSHCWHRALQLSPKSLGLTVQPSGLSAKRDRGEMLVVDALGRKLNETMRLLLEAASREEITVVFQSLSQLVCWW